MYCTQISLDAHQVGSAVHSRQIWQEKMVLEIAPPLAPPSSSERRPFALLESSSENAKLKQPTRYKPGPTQSITSTDMDSRIEDILYKILLYTQVILVNN